MTQSKWIVTGVALLALAFSTAVAQDAATGGKARRDKAASAPAKDKAGTVALSDQVATMTKELSLSDADAAKIKAKVEQTTAAVDKWDKDNADKLKELRAAKKGDDQAAADKAGTDAKALQQERAKILADGEIEVELVLTAEQRTAWQGYKLSLLAKRQLGKLTLTDDQVAQVRTMCNDAAKQMASATEDKAKNKARKQLMADIQAKVLTDAQREQLAPKDAAAGDTPKAGKAADATKTTP
jgi:hypothetical protein